MSGKFIVFEGLDGSGKSTQIDLLIERLRVAGHRTAITAEPTELPVGRLIRDVIEHRLSAHPQAVAAMFAADRLQHLHEPQTGILDQLAAGVSVIGSRYYFSSLAYQADCADIEWIASLNQQAKNTRPADLTIFLDLPPEVSIERITKGRDQVDLFENFQKLTDVRVAFERAFDYWGDDAEHIIQLDARVSVDELSDQIWTAVRALYPDDEVKR
jgi:dTMP kinase